MSTERDTNILETLWEEADTNPLDTVAEIMERQNWSFECFNNTIAIEVRGQYCVYRISIIWEEPMNAMQFCMQYDFTVHGSNLENAAETLKQVNQKLWMGHFEIPDNTHIPAFRYTTLLGGNTQATNMHQFGEILDIATSQCERCYPAFHLLKTPQAANDENLSLALMETKGMS
ncbi:MAG: YbjN domain-containing protein [Alphaproteobacteria bacterium]